MKIIKLFFCFLFFVVIGSCSSENIFEQEINLPEKGNILAAGAGCTIHLVEKCPADCFSAGGTHPCLNPDHAGMVEYNPTFQTWDCIGCEGGNQTPNPKPDPEPKYCFACKTCFACLENRNNQDSEKNNNGIDIPIQPNLHTCDCRSCTCCD